MPSIIQFFSTFGNICHVTIKILYLIFITIIGKGEVFSKSRDNFSTITTVTTPGFCPIF